MIDRMQGIRESRPSERDELIKRVCSLLNSQEDISPVVSSGGINLFQHIDGEKVFIRLTVDRSGRAFRSYARSQED